MSQCLEPSVALGSEDAIYWQDLTVGRVWRHGPYEVTEREITEFARQFDPLPMHVDPDRAKASGLGMLCASGVHVFGMAQRLMCEALFLKSEVIAGGAIDDFRMRVPVVPGDQLTLNAVVLESRPHLRRLDAGWTLFRVRLERVDHKVVLDYRITVLFRRRAAAPGASAG